MMLFPCPLLPDVLRALGLCAWLSVHHILTLSLGCALTATVLGATMLCLSDTGHKKVCAAIWMLPVLISLVLVDPVLCGWWEFGLAKTGADAVVQKADALISGFTGCSPQAGAASCLVMATPPGIWWPHLRSIALTKEQVDARRAYFMSLLMMLPLATGVAVKVLQLLVVRARRSEESEPNYAQVGLIQRPPRLPLAIHLGYHVYCSGLAGVCFWLSGASFSMGIAWEVYVVWMASVLAINVALVCYALRSRKPSDLPDLALAVMNPITPLGELFDVFKDWLFVALSASLGSPAGFAIAFCSVLVLLTSIAIMRALHPDDLLGAYLPVLGKTASPPVNSGLKGKLLQSLEKATAPAKMTITLTENLPQALLQSILAWFARSSTQVTVVALTVFKLICTCAVYVPVRIANNRVTAVAAMRVGIWKRLVGVCRQALGDRHPRTGDCMEKLACAYRDVGKRESAVELHRQCLELRRAVLGERHADTLRSMNDLAHNLVSIGDSRGAAELHRQCLVLQKEILGDRHPDTRKSMNELAIALRATGDSKAAAEAAELSRTCLAMETELRGERHPDTLKTMNGLANALRNNGDAQGAAEFHRRCLELRKEILGERHPETLKTTNDLATDLRDMSDFEGAAELHRECLELRKQTLGARHPDTLVTMDDLAKDLTAMGKSQDAAELHRQCVAFRKEILGERHPKTLTSMHGLACDLAAVGDAQGAADLHRRCVELRREVLGESHPTTLKSMGDLATALCATGDSQGAAELERRQQELMSD